MTILPLVKVNTLVKVKVKVNFQLTQLVELPPNSSSSYAIQTRDKPIQLVESLHRLVESHLVQNRDKSTQLVESPSGLVESPYLFGLS